MISCSTRFFQSKLEETVHCDEERLGMYIEAGVWEMGLDTGYVMVLVMLPTTTSRGVKMMLIVVTCHTENSYIRLIIAVNSLGERVQQADTSEGQPTHFAIEHRGQNCSPQSLQALKQLSQDKRSQNAHFFTSWTVRQAEHGAVRSQTAGGVGMCSDCFNLL